MKKNGFILVETLVATTLIAVVFTFLYIQFSNINENYRKTYENNTVEGLYGLNNIESLILSNGYEEMIENVDTYIDITSCSYVTNISQCNNLLNALEVKQLILMKDDIINLKQTILTDDTISDNFKSFIKIVNTDTVLDGYRLLVEYQNNVCATIKVGI